MTTGKERTYRFFHVVFNPWVFYKCTQIDFLGALWSTILVIIPGGCWRFNKTVSQSCTVAKSEKFWWVTGQSNLADRMEDCSTGQRAVVEYENQTLEAYVAISCLYAKFDCPVACQNFTLIVKLVYSNCFLGEKRGWGGGISCWLSLIFSFQDCVWTSISFFLPPGAAVHLASLLAAHGYVFSITDHHLMVKDDASYYRFQVNSCQSITVIIMQCVLNNFCFMRLVLDTLLLVVKQLGTGECWLWWGLNWIFI